MSKSKQILFRCSSLGNLMTNGRGKNDAMGETAKSLISDVFLQTKYGYREEVITDPMLKGHLCETESRTLIKKVLGGEFRKRNTERLSNDFIIGTPDIILEKEPVVEDVKNSFTLKTFHNAELIKVYYWQGQGYMWLTDKTDYRLIYTLNPTPEEMIIEQEKRYYFKFGCDESNPDYIKICQQIRWNNDIIHNLKNEERVKVFEFKRSDEDIEALKVRIELACEYYATLKL
jgi:hypothetical protein